jgi:hypothetical protein
MARTLNGRLLTQDEIDHIAGSAFTCWDLCGNVKESIYDTAMDDFGVRLSKKQVAFILRIVHGMADKARSEAGVAGKYLARAASGIDTPYGHGYDKAIYP